MKKILLTLLALLSILDAQCAKRIEDFSGTKVCIPQQIDSIIITCYGGASQEVALFDADKKIVALPDSSSFAHFIKVYPLLQNTPSVGTFDDVNLETLLKHKPSIVFVGATSYPTNKKIADSGIPTFTLGIGKHTIPTLLDEFIKVGELLGSQKKALQLVKYWQKHLADIEQKLSHIKDKKVLFYTSSRSTNDIYNWNDEFISAIGALNMVKVASIDGEITLETLLQHNPDAILTTTNGTSALSYGNLKKSTLFPHLKAVRNSLLLEAPVGSFWWDRPSPEAILGIMWVAKKLYPNELASLDIQKESEYFFKEFYNYNLSRSEYLSFFNKENL